MKKITLRSVLIAVAFSLSASLQAEAPAKELRPLPVHIGGRVATETTADGQKKYQYSWPSVYFETAFKGSDLILKFDDNQNIFQLIIDNNPPVIINKPGKIDYPVLNLKPGAHRVRLEKITETQALTAYFLGFYASNHTQNAPLPQRTRQIEFIGDSFTVGYGNTSAKQDCNEQDVYQTTNSQLSFAALTAKELDADYQVNAYSGLGVVRNYNGITPDKSLIKIYPYTQNAASPAYTGKWQPQVIVIGLGTNDFSTPLNTSERWSSREQLQNDYVAQYIGFVQKLHSQHPKAQFILMASDSLKNEIADQLKRVVNGVKAAGINDIDSIIFGGLDYKGCHGHPSVKDNQLLKDLLMAKLKTNVKW